MRPGNRPSPQVGGVLLSPHSRTTCACEGCQKIRALDEHFERMEKTEREEILEISRARLLNFPKESLS